MNLVTKCFFTGTRFLSDGDSGHVKKIAVIQLSQTAEPKDYIYSVACEV